MFEDEGVLYFKTHSGSPWIYISKMESSNPIIHWSYRQEIKIQADRRNDIVFEDFHRIEKLEGGYFFQGCS